MTDLARWNELYRDGIRWAPHDGIESDLLAEHAGDGHGKRALDIACGAGDYTAHLAGLGYRVTGVDYAEAAIDRARAAHPDLDFHLLDVETGAFAARESGFDLITCRLAYAFMADKPAFLRRVQALLAPGGLFHVYTPQAESLPADRAYIGITRAEHEQLLAAGWSSHTVCDLRTHTSYFLHA